MTKTGDEPVKPRVAPPPLPHEVHERDLDPHEESIHEEMLRGGLKHYENEKLVE